MTLKGRYWVGIWLVLALATLVSVAARQTSGFATAQQLRAARDEHSALDAQKGELERRIRQASSRQVLIPRAAANLGLHEPAATEMTVLALPADAPGGIPVDAAPARADTAKKATPARPRAQARAPSRRAPARKPPARRPAPARRH